MVRNGYERHKVLEYIRVQTTFKLRQNYIEIKREGLVNYFIHLQSMCCNYRNITPPIVDIKNAWSYTSTIHISSWRGDQLSKGDYRGSIPGGGWEFFSSTPCPDRDWGQRSHLCNGYWGLFTWGKAAGA